MTSNTTCEGVISQQSFQLFHVGRVHPYLEWKAFFSSCYRSFRPQWSHLTTRVCLPHTRFSLEVLNLTTIILNPWSIPDTTGSLHHHTPGLPTPYEVGSYLISSCVMRVSLPYPQGPASATPHQRHHTAELEHKPLGTRHSPIRSDLKDLPQSRRLYFPKG